MSSFPSRSRGARPCLGPAERSRELAPEPLEAAGDRVVYSKRARPEAISRDERRIEPDLGLGGLGAGIRGPGGGDPVEGRLGHRAGGLDLEPGYAFVSVAQLAVGASDLRQEEGPALVHDEAAEAAEDGRPRLAGPEGGAYERGLGALGHRGVGEAGVQPRLGLDREAQALE